MWTVSKFDELRAKTDRQLVTIINHTIDRGLILARVHNGDNSPRNAENACLEAARLLTRVYNLSERIRLTARLAELRNALETHAEAKVRAACG